MPELHSEPTVPYPEGAHGDVTVWLTVQISATGVVDEVSADEVAEPFSSAAERAVRGWKFSPATKGGASVAAMIRVSVVFTEPEPEPKEEATGTDEPPASGEPSTVDGETPQEPGEPHEIVVHGERTPPSRSATFSRAEVRLIPGTFGDPFRAIGAMPGVTPIVSGLPFFFIRGAPPGNVGYYLDGIRVPLLFHVGVGPSVVHPALIDRVDLYPGGYPARFGRFAGGIVSGETAADERRFRGEYNVRAFDAGAMVEAPFAGGRGSAIVGGRYSYTALLFSLLSPETVLQYWDYQTRVSYDLTSTDRISVFGFGSYDFLGQKTATSTLTLFGTEFHRVDLRYDHDIGSRGKMRTAFTGGLDKSEVSQGRSVRDRMFATRTQLDYRLSPAVLWRAGADLRLDVYDVLLGPNNLSPAARQAASLFPTRTDLNTGVRTDVVIDVTRGFEVTPGVRVDLYGSKGNGAVGVDPRLGVRKSLTSHLRLVGAMGIAHQAPSFVVPVPGFQPGGLQGGLQSAWQESLGLQLDLDEDTTLTATTFQNGFFNMSDPLGSNQPQLLGCPPGTFPTGTLAGDPGSQPSGNGSFCGNRFPPGTLGADRSGGGGQASQGRGGQRVAQLLQVRSMGVSRGLEIFLKRNLTKKLGGFLAYTLSRSTRSYGNRSYIASFDRTHVVNLAAAYDLGRRWRVGGRTMFYTGLPKAPDPTNPGSTRLPSFFRLDFRIEKRWQLGERTWISGVVEWMNATLSKEAIATRCTLDGCESQMIGPVTMPSIGIEGGF